MNDKLNVLFRKVFKLKKLVTYFEIFIEPQQLAFYTACGKIYENIRNECNDESSKSVFNGDLKKK